MPKAEKAVIMFFYKLDRMIVKGWMGGHRTITPRGLAIVDQLLAEGYVLSDADMVSLIHHRMSNMSYEEKQGVFLLMKQLEVEP